MNRRSFRLFFRQILKSASHHQFAFYFLKIVSPEMFKKIRILMRDLPFMAFQTIIVHVCQLAGHCAFRDDKDTMEVQSVFFRGPLPDTDIPPTFS